MTLKSMIYSNLKRVLFLCFQDKGDLPGVVNIVMNDAMNEGVIGLPMAGVGHQFT
jgi:hypothetical protein